VQATPAPEGVDASTLVVLAAGLGRVAPTRNALVRTLQFKLVGMSKRSASWHRSAIHLQCVAWHSSLWEMLPRLPGGGGRLLVAYAHPSNGVGNRLSGLRASLALAQESNRRLVIRFAGDGQETVGISRAAHGPPQLVANGASVWTGQ
jgi:hypothetical protein